LGNYRQHITFAGVLGIAFGWATYLLAGIHWIYGSVAALLATLGGLLPDLDSDSGVELKGFTGILGVIAAVTVWQAMGKIDPPPVFEFHIWAAILAFIAVRHGLRRVLSHLTKHRGISHSVPTCAVWGALTYLYYPSDYQQIRMAMALAVMLGFFSHLLLDEICSVDLRGARVNKAFGTAIKLWSQSSWATVIMYALLSYLAWRIIQIWPDGPYSFDPPAPPRIPISLPKQFRLPPVPQGLGR
jgi:LexA-binding, inner membrane-associated putative hydrolase